MSRPSYLDPWKASQLNCLRLDVDVDNILANCRQKSKVNRRWASIVVEITQGVDVKALTLSGGVLVLSVPSPAHGQEYTFMFEEQWLARMNEELGVGAVERIRFVVR